MAADAPPPAGDPPEPRPGRSCAGCWRCCATAPPRATRSTRAAWCGSPSTAATACARCAPRPASLRRAHAGHAAAVSHPDAARRHAPPTSRCCSRYGVAFELLDRDGCIRARAGAGARARQVRRRPAAARRRDRRLLQVHAAPGRARGAARRRVPLRHAHPARCKRDGERIAGVDTDAGTLKADAYLVALGSYSPLLLRPLGIRIPVYPVKGYSITRADHRRRAARPNRR